MERMTHLAEQGQRSVGVEAEVEIFRIEPRSSRESNLHELCSPFYLRCKVFALELERYLLLQRILTVSL
jgi:hypothetical protein